MSKPIVKWSIAVGGFLLDHWAWIASTGVGLVVAVLTALTKPLRAYAPASYAAAFLATVLVVMALIALAGFFAERIAKRGFWNHVREPVKTVNPLDATFTGIRVAAGDIADPETRVIVGKTFVGCEIVGRRLTLMFSSSILQNVRGAFGCDFISVPIAQGQHIQTRNTFIFHQCVFRDCKFYYMTMLFSHYDAQVMINTNQVPRDQWLVPPPPA
jgi:hypothetical protein